MERYMIHGERDSFRDVSTYVTGLQDNVQGILNFVENVQQILS